MFICDRADIPVLIQLKGYDLKQLFIGAEGTLGIITGVSILTPPAPQASNNMVLSLSHFDNVLPLYKIVKRQLSEILTAFEFFDRAAYDVIVKHGQGRGLSDEAVDGAECFVLVETSGARREHDEEVHCPLYMFPLFFFPKMFFFCRKSTTYLRGL
jgi:FAD/FMN-containing dehydrogenase